MKYNLSVQGFAFFRYMIKKRQKNLRTYVYKSEINDYYYYVLDFNLYSSIDQTC